MTKAERLEIEAHARAAAGSLFSCDPSSVKVPFPCGGKPHEFDIYARGVVIGGVTTSPLVTSRGSRNTGGCDRACSELLWLTLWPGTERRMHVLTDRDLANWLIARYKGIPFPHAIWIYHYDNGNYQLTAVGRL